MLGKVPIKIMPKTNKPLSNKILLEKKKKRQALLSTLRSWVDRMMQRPDMASRLRRRSLLTKPTPRPIKPTPPPIRPTPTPRPIKPTPPPIRPTPTPRPIKPTPPPMPVKIPKEPIQRSRYSSSPIRTKPVTQPNRNIGQYIPSHPLESAVKQGKLIRTAVRNKRQQLRNKLKGRLI